MKKSILHASLVAASCACLPVLASSQEMVHAFTGTVSSINSASKTITVFKDNGETGTFNEMANSKTRLSFDKKLAQETVNAASFTDQGAYAIVFYYGMMENPTVVAVKALGKGPFAASEGTITDFNSHDHSLSIADAAGKVSTFKLTSDSVAEGSTGAVEALKLPARKGDHVRIVSATVDGSPTALFVRDL
jgi:hypothetical protein